MKICFDVTDKRNVIAMEYFRQKGYNVGEFDQNLIKNDTFCVFSPAKKWILSEINQFPNDITIVTGAINEACAELVKIKNIRYINMLDDETFAIQNANLTAEGVLAILIKETDISIFQSKILIVGVGRIAKALAILFGRLGLNYTLGSFSEKDRINGNFYLCPCLPKGEFKKHVSEFDVIINTIPNIVFDEVDCFRIKPGTVLIETASKNCLDYQDGMPFKVVLAPRLPQVYSLKSASKLVINKIEEVLDD